MSSDTSSTIIWIVVILLNVGGFLLGGVTHEGPAFGDHLTTR